MDDLPRWLSDISSKLIPDFQGGWSVNKRDEVSYPETGHGLCMQIEDLSFWFRHRNRCIVELVHLFPSRGPVFDVGGGNGFVSKGLADSGVDTILLEPGLEAVRNARQRGISHIVCSGFEEAGFADHSLPAVGLFDVLEHIRDDKAFLLLLKKKLILNGRLYITVPAYPFLWSFEDDFAGHYRRYTLPSLSERLRGAGFQIDFASYFFSLLPPIILMGRSLPSKFKLKKASNSQEHKTAHSGGAAFITQILERLFRPEVFLLRRKMRIPFGGSCIVSASVPSEL